jgi:hypothetical protein
MRTRKVGWLGLALVLILALSLVALHRSPTSKGETPVLNSTALRPESRMIILTVEGKDIVCTQRETFNESAYRRISANWVSYSSKLKEKMLKTYGSEGTKIASLNVSLGKERRTVEVDFTVVNKVTVNSEVTADFLWFLGPWNLDLLDDKFNETEHGLTWEGVLEGVPTSITVNVPPQAGPYKAWGSPYGHCHGHVWWPKG